MRDVIFSSAGTGLDAAGVENYAQPRYHLSTSAVAQVLNSILVAAQYSYILQMMHDALVAE
jgi:hypothetical protein